MSQPPAFQPENIYLIKDICENSKVFIDTCSLLESSFFQIESILFKKLKKANQKLIVPKKVVDELNKHSASTDASLARAAKRALKHLAVQQQNNLISIKGDPTDNFADNVFLTQFTRHRLKYNLTLITQDNGLAWDIMNLNTLKSQRTSHSIRVFRISKQGTLEPSGSSQQNTANKKSPLELKISQPMEEIHPSNDAQSLQQNTDDEEPLFELKNSLPAYKDEKLPMHHIPTEGEQIYAAVRKEFITLTSRIGKGGEGAVYRTNVPGTVCKIYDAEKVTRFRCEKLRRMLDSNFSFPGICWPTDVVFNNEQKVVGYLMPEAKGYELQKSVFIPMLLNQRFKSWQRVDLVRLAVTILNKIAYLHKHNIIIGDINPGNILVSSTDDVYFVDVDSYQIEEFPSPVGTVPFTPPELQGKNFSSLLRSRENELFAVATLLFEIMLPGKSPYAQQGGEDQGTNIRNMDFSYPCGSKSNKKTPNGPWRYCWSHLPYSIKEAFYETFRYDGEHAKPENRLSAKDWLTLFQEYQDLLESGKFTDRDPESGLIFPKRFKIVSGNIEKCRLCGKDFAEDDLNNGYCRDCLYQGEESPCPKCGKPLIYTNYRKLILKKPPFTLCKDCVDKLKEVYSTPKCVNCGKSFTISNGEKDYFDQKGFELPRRCPACRKQAHVQNRGKSMPSSSSRRSKEFSISDLLGGIFNNFFGR